MRNKITVKALGTNFLENFNGFYDVSSFSQSVSLCVKGPQISVLFPCLVAN